MVAERNAGNPAKSPLRSERRGNAPYAAHVALSLPRGPPARDRRVRQGLAGSRSSLGTSHQVRSIYQRAFHEGGSRAGASLIGAANRGGVQKVPHDPFLTS